MNRRFYIAYGSNLNVGQMAYRCPDAKIVGVGELKNHRATFRGNWRGCGVMDIEACEGKSVPVAIWSISNRDEENLDVYEGYPRLYEKKSYVILVDGKAEEAIAYVMTPGHPLTAPASSYYNTICEGYKYFGFERDVLDEARTYSSRLS